MTFGATDQVFTGFRLTREKPILLLWLGLAFAITSALSIALAYPAFVQLMTYVSSVQAGHEPTQDEMMALFGAYGRMLLVGMPLSLICMSLVMPAIVRAVIEPADSRFGYLRFGRDELNTFVVLLAMSLTWFGIMFMGGLVIGLAGTAGVAVGLLVGLIVVLAVAAAAAWLAVKFSLAVPITVIEKRIGLAESFRMTKGHFWPLLGMGLLLAVLSFGVSLLVNIVAMPFSMISGGGFGPLVSGEFTVASVIGMAGTVALTVLVSAAQSLILYAPFSAVYRVIKNS